MALSVFDLFKIGIGPSSSHTVGPMRAACQFIQYLMENKLIEETRRVQIKLYGSLSATGVGHGTDNAILLGLMGFEPETIDTDRVNSLVETIKRDRVLRLNNHHPIVFDYHHDVIFLQESLPYHPNAMTFTVWGQQAEIYSNTLYSIGGGFIVSQQQTQEGGLVNDKTRLPYPFSSADELLHLCKTHRLSVSNLMMENEKCWRSEEEVRTKILSIWCVMQKCIENGIKHEGVLPGGLRVKRRAHQFHQRLLDANKGFVE